MNGLKPALPLIELVDKYGVTLEYLEKQLAKGVIVEKEHTDDLQLATKIALDHINEMADYYDKLKTMEKQNALQMPKVYYCKHIEKGVTGYKDETILVDDECLNKMDKTMAGVPVRVLHVDNVDMTKLQEESDGYVSESFYCKEDGWHWAKFIAVSDACHKAIRDGWSVSNAYIPSGTGAGGESHNITYNRKILDGKYTHLAIVPNPRYEGALIMTPEEFKAYKVEKTQELQNSKKGKIMFKFFKKEQVEQDMDESTIVQLKNGKEITLSELQNASEELEALKNEVEELKKENKKLKKNMETEEDVNKKKENEEETDEEKKKREEAELQAKKNEEEEESKKNEEEKEKEKQKENARFKELKNAGGVTGDPIQKIETSQDQVARGQARYGK